MFNTVKMAEPFSTQDLAIPGATEKEGCVKNCMKKTSFLPLRTNVWQFVYHHHK
jgi:hypothetical protein